ncbi:PH domain-containing protein [Georgenia sp. Z1344]|uniref:PH domain-containing protein n=1 Tax=Georgenia sp. Z1344 TaxID=3416706 RepID=UPI003CFAAFB9
MRLVARVLQVAVVVGAAAIIVFTGRIPGVDHWGLTDQLLTALLALVIVAILERQARVAALPDEDGLTVRNFLAGRRVEWAEILGVEYGEHRPWANLDLTDSTTLAVMAVQRSDGSRAAADAQRLSTLIELHAREAGPRG